MMSDDVITVLLEVVAFTPSACENKMLIFNRGNHFIHTFIFFRFSEFALVADAVI